MRVSGQGVGFRGGRFWQLAILAAAGTIGLAPQAKAALFYWDDSAPVITGPAVKAPLRHAKGIHHGDKKSRAVIEKESKPQGPLIISISVAQQKLRLYDANGLYAESPISTGMPGHPTPMGVFSIIQKQKFHKSNIYSGAPMPFMQRITWSGVAMHAGVLPGYPASHGCIRMPMAFAVKMYGWTRMGARVIVTPGDVTPTSFSHPLLATIKVAPQPVTLQETKTDMAAVQAPEKPASSEASPLANATETKFELRSTVGNVDPIKPVTEESRTPATLKTADASGALPAALATSGTTGGIPASEPAPKAAGVSASDQGTSKAAKQDDVTASDAEPGKPGEVQPAKIADADAKPSESASAPSSKPEAASTPETAPAANDAAKLNDVPAAANNAPAEAPRSATAAETPNEKPAEATPAVAATPPAAQPIKQAAPPTATTEAPLKDDLKSDFAKSAASTTDAGFSFQGSGQIAVFVSRKDSKLYIRQNFAPLFQIPVTIAADTRPLGTHIFTAQVDSHDANLLHWSVISLPTVSKSAERRAEERNSRGHRFASAARAEAKPLPTPDTPAEALDRLSLPSGVMAKIYEAVSTGGSIIVSDQGIAAGETGEGTDFIVSLR